jgi:hypothetical protein
VGARLLRQRGEQPVEADLDRRRGPRGLERQRAVEHVRRRHAEVEPARRRTGQLLDVGEEGDHVVAGGGLDREDARRIEAPRRLGPHLLGGAGRDPAQALHRRARRQLDVEPQVVAGGVGPDRGELGASITVDHDRRGARGRRLRTKVRTAGARPGATTTR